MTKTTILLLLIGSVTFLASSSQSFDSNAYTQLYQSRLNDFSNQELDLLQRIERLDLNHPQDLETIRMQIILTRTKMKGVDFWLRYLDPIAYKKINGPLPVEWETEVFEKFEKPYKRMSAGLTLASLYLENPKPQKDSLIGLIQASILATESYRADSTTGPMQTFPHFLFCNRLYLLNLAAIYTTGFECPETARIIPELRNMMVQVREIYTAYNQQFPATPMPDAYLKPYEEAIKFVQQQPEDYTQFDHFGFIRDHINPLFALNQSLIRQYEALSGSYVDYSLNNESGSIFDKNLYYAQNVKGLYLRVQDEKTLAQIDRLGKLLFYDPIVSGNNLRSCASCHKPTEYFTDTSSSTSLQYNRKDFLLRNTPTLINVGYNHLIMLDGKHFSLLNQAKEVTSNPLELHSKPAEILNKVLSCPEYKSAFTQLLQQTPQAPAITFEHLASAMTLYYTKFSYAYAPFDEAMDQGKLLPPAAIRGFNLFMSKAQCATCHFLPQFNGSKPPYVGSEFEVLGVPENKNFKALSTDQGRYEINPAGEMLHAFRTGNLRNATQTKPYMHNGVFTSLEEVLDFYDSGGGIGKGLLVDNQTLSSDSLHLSAAEKSDLLEFIRTLDEKIPFETPPTSLPVSRNKSLNTRKVGGEY